MIVLAIALSALIGQAPAASPCPAGSGPAVAVAAGVEVCERPVATPIDGDHEVGVVIASLAADHRFATSGLKVGDVIVRVAGERVRQPKQLESRLAAVAAEREVLINFRRAGLPLLVRVGR